MSQRIAYRAAGPFVARQGFDFGPRHVEPGEQFAPTEHGALEHQVYGLWLAQLVDVDAVRVGALGGFEVLARIGAAFTGPPPPVPTRAKAKPKRASAEA